MSIVDELELKMYRAKENYNEADRELKWRLEESGNWDWNVYIVRRIRDGIDDLEDTYMSACKLYYMALDAEHRGVNVDEKWVKNNEDVKEVEATV